MKRDVARARAAVASRFVVRECSYAWPLERLLVKMERLVRMGPPDSCLPPHSPAAQNKRELCLSAGAQRFAVAMCVLRLWVRGSSCMLLLLPRAGGNEASVASTVSSSGIVVDLPPGGGIFAATLSGTDYDATTSLDED